MRRSRRWPRISIHSLLAEGDTAEKWVAAMRNISIHSLLAEGDPSISPHYKDSTISIHSLLAEGDGRKRAGHMTNNDFNPLPPRGGRRARAAQRQLGRAISIHSLLAEGDRRIGRKGLFRAISIHSLLAEGDLYAEMDSMFDDISIHSLLAEGDVAAVRFVHSMIVNFNPLPPRGGRHGRRNQCHHC